MNALIIAISAGLAAIGLASIIRWVNLWLVSKFRFRPFQHIWSPFRHGNTVIVLSARAYGNTIKVSFSECEAAWMIQRLLSSPLSRKNVRIYTSNDPTIPLDCSNVIAIGDEEYNDVARKILHGAIGNFTYSYTKGNNLILNERVYPSEYDNRTLVSDHALVLKARNPFAPQQSALVFAGNHGLGTLGSVLALTTESDAKKVIAKVRQQNFYAVVNSTFQHAFPRTPTAVSVKLCNFLIESGDEAHPLRVVREDELKAFLQRLGANDRLLEHMKVVCGLASQIADSLVDRGVDVDVDAVYFGAMLHDIGRTVSGGIEHALEGAKLVEEHREELLRTFGLRSDRLSKVIEAIRCHVVGGIPVAWIREKALALPEEDFAPKSTEAKLVALCDQLVHRWDSHEDVFKEAPDKAPEVFERLYYFCKEIMLNLYPSQPQGPAPVEGGNTGCRVSR